LACVVVKQGATVTTEHIDDHLGKRFAKWWVPDAMVFMDAVPKTSVGTFDKKALREQFKDVQLATAAGDEDRSSGRFQA
jgi:fatty-acyl-CoA synthase